MSIAGNWTLHYSWGCSGGYGQTSLTFNANGTFNTGDGYHGQWTVVAGNVQFVFEPAPMAVYSGNVTGGAMVGMMTNLSLKEQGCWYATLPTIPAAQAVKTQTAHAEGLDSTGTKKK
jgi:hypothetical protein